VPTGKKKQPKKAKREARHCEEKTPGPGKYYGGKADGKARVILSQHQPPSEYLIHVEPYGGMAAVKLNLPLTTAMGGDVERVDIYNELNPRLTQMFQVIGDSRLEEPFLRRIQLCQYDENLYKEVARMSKAEWEKLDDPVEKAFCTFVLYAMSFSGRTPSSPKGKKLKSPEEVIGCFSKSLKRIRRGMCDNVSGFLSKADHWAPIWIEKVRQWQCLCCDAMQVIADYDGERTMFYLDPPYLPSTRAKEEPQDYHTYELTESKHEALLQLIKTCKGKVLLSGYDSLLYRKYLKAPQWHMVRWLVKNQVTAAGQPKKDAWECLWMNYPPQPFPKNAKKMEQVY